MIPEDGDNGPSEDQQTPYQEFDARMRRLGTKWRRRPSKWASPVIEVGKFLVGLATLVAIVGTGFVAYRQLAAMNASIQQATTLNKLTADSVQAAKDAAAAAKSSAAASELQASASIAQVGATTRANTLTEQIRRDNLAALREERRARLSYGMVVEQKPTVDQPVVRFGMPVIITGTTDASRVRLASRFFRIPAGTSPPEIANQTWTDREWTTAGVVSAGELNRTFRTTVTLTKEQVDAYLRGALNAALIFRLEYCDAYGRRHHLTRCGVHASTQAVGQITYCGVETDINNGEQGQPECQP